jgi:hypothetical protein
LSDSILDEAEKSKILMALTRNHRRNAYKNFIKRILFFRK